MAEHSDYIGHVNIDPAENGWIVKWLEKGESTTESFYDHCEHVQKKKVFTSKETDKAFDHFKKLKLQELGK
ncbi:MAG: hypothetical protein ACTSRU_00715 [Candidatus Hodarchaeales archaeon]